MPSARSRAAPSTKVDTSDPEAKRIISIKMGIVGLCSDHAGFELKEYIKTILDERGLSYKDFGTYSSDRRKLLSIES